MPSIEQIQREMRRKKEAEKAASLAAENTGTVTEENSVIKESSVAESPAMETSITDTSVEIVDKQPEVPDKAESESAVESDNADAALPADDVSSANDADFSVENEHADIFKKEPDIPPQVMQDGASDDDAAYVSPDIEDEPPISVVDTAVEKAVTRHNKKKEKKQPGRPRKDNTDKTDLGKTVRIDIPIGLASLMRAQIPEAGTNSEAAAAWIYAKSDRACEVADDVKKLAATFTGDQVNNILKDMNAHIMSLDSRIVRMQALTDGRVQELWYMIAYLMLERMDAINKPHLKDMDLSMPVFETLKTEVNRQFRKVRNRQQLAEGRSIYQSKFEGKGNEEK